MKSDRQLSIEAGRHYNWLATIKATNKELYDYVKEHGIREFEDESMEIRQFLSTIYYDSKMNELYEKYASDLFKNEASFRSSFLNAAFAIGEKPLSWHAFKRFKLFKERIENVQKR